ncbi:recombinase family protein [Salmonirosea aquatica]|uniref:Resolvase n=1 Tax=Salmonirosea aquatica TaxID=2654236 RepID=A0A7C9FC59_9BACT|nr:resolvase [Cytophagaceae bacterium SJW1-29]
MIKDDKEYVAYYHVSTHRQGDSGLGLEAQHTYINYFYQGRNLIAEFTDVRSGKDIRNREQLQAALALCRKRGATLVVAKVDRLSRDTEQALWIYRELDERLESCDIPNLDKFTLTLFMAIADRERELTSIRTKVALVQKVKRSGEWRRGSAAFRSGEASRLGTKTVRQTALMNTNSRQAMAQIRHLLVEGYNITRIARQLNEDGFRAPRGGRYSAMQVKRLCERIAEVDTIPLEQADLKDS